LLSDVDSKLEPLRTKADASDAQALLCLIQPIKIAFAPSTLEWLKQMHSIIFFLLSSVHLVSNMRTQAQTIDQYIAVLFAPTKEKVIQTIPFPGRALAKLQTTRALTEFAY